MSHTFTTLLRYLKVSNGLTELSQRDILEAEKDKARQNKSNFFHPTSLFLSIYSYLTSLLISPNFIIGSLQQASQIVSFLLFLS